MALSESVAHLYTRRLATSGSLAQAASRRFLTAMHAARRRVYEPSLATFDNHCDCISAAETKSSQAPPQIALLQGV